MPWAPEQDWFPARLPRQLAEILPDAHIVHVANSGGFIMLEQPGALAAAIREFVSARSETQSSRAPEPRNAAA